MRGVAGWQVVGTVAFDTPSMGSPSVTLERHLGGLRAWQVVGTVASDTLSVGSPPITVDNQGFGLVFRASTDFLGVSCDGLFVRPSPRPLANVLGFWGYLPSLPPSAAGLVNLREPPALRRAH